MATTKQQTQLQQLYNSQLAREEQLAAQRQQQAQTAYDQNMASLANAYSQRAALLQNNYQSSLVDLQRGYDTSAGQINTATGSALQQAYVNMMMNKRDLPQTLSAQGISGGLSESTTAGLYKNYGGTRGQLEATRTQNLGQLAEGLAANQSEAQRSYNTSLAADEQQRLDYELQLRTALANLNAQILSEKYQNLGQIDTAYQQQLAAKSW